MARRGLSTGQGESKETLGIDQSYGCLAESDPRGAALVVVRSHQTGRVARGLAKFGLVLTWAKDDKISRRTHYASSMAAAEKPIRLHLILAADDDAELGRCSKLEEGERHDNLHKTHALSGSSHALDRCTVVTSPSR